MDHNALCQLAVTWLRRPQSRQGPGCQVAISEPRCGYLDGEIPDTIGFRCGVHNEASVVVEAKVSRADFLADAGKPHRISPSEGVGLFRYYLAPAGVIKPDELPSRWGLIEVTSKGVLKVRAGHTLESAYDATHEHWQHERNMQREWSMLARMVMKIGDADEVQRRMRALYREKAELSKAHDKVRQELRELRMTTFRNERLLRHPDVQKVVAGLLDAELVASPRKPPAQAAAVSE